MPKFKTIFEQGTPIVEVRTTIFGSEYICLFCGESFDERASVNPKRLVMLHVKTKHRRKK